MVSTASIVVMAISAILCFILPITVMVYYRKQRVIGYKPVVVGAMVFFVFSQVLEKLLHMAVLGNNIITNPILIAIYGALAAGIFEEGGRYLAFRWVLKDRKDWGDGLAYGIGHGGIEMILIGSVSYVQYISFSNLINNGLFDATLYPNVTEAQAAQLGQLKDLLIHMPIQNILIGSAERIFAFGIQLALTFVVLYAVRSKKSIFVLWAVLLHALVDVPAVLYQMKYIDIAMAEGITAVFFAGALFFLTKTKIIFKEGTH